MIGMLQQMNIAENIYMYVFVRTQLRQLRKSQ